MPETGARPYLACLEERRTRELFESAVRSFTGNPTNAAITFCTSFQEFTERLIIQPWPQLAVFTCNSSTIREALLLRGRYPEIALVPWAQAGIENRVLVDLVNGGFPHIILAGGNDSPREVEEVICTALVKPLHSGLLQKLEIALTPRMTEFLSHLLRATRRPFTPADAACLYASDASTLRRHLAHHGLPPIGRLIGWFRLFHAALLLESRRTSVEVAANSLEFPSRTALLNQIRRYCRISSSEFRRLGARGVLELFVTRECRPVCSEAKMRFSVTSPSAGVTM